MGELRYSQTSKDHSALILFLLRRFSKKHYLTHSQVIPYMLHIVQDFFLLFLNQLLIIKKICFLFEGVR